LDRAKFNEAPWVSGERGATLRLDITLENPIDFEIGLLLLALKDFWLGRANLGGEASLGRGRLRGERALLTLRHCGGNHQRWLLQQGQGGQISCGKGDKDSLEKFVEAAKDCPKEYNPIISRRSLTELHNDVLEGRS
jgi:hypothetical protein